MAYISTEQVKEIRKELNKAFPGIKFGVKRERYAVIQITIKSSPFFPGIDYKQVNPYSIERNYTGEEAQFLRQVVDIAEKGQTHHETCDYGRQPSYYIYMYVGSLEKSHACYVVSETGTKVMAKKKQI